VARLIELAGGGPVNEGERVVVQGLLRELPDDYVVAPNVEIADGRGQRLEYDVVVAAPHAVYVVETKMLLGSVVGDDREWVVNGSTRPAPIRITAHKARVLKSFLTAERPVLRSCWVEPVVVLAAPPRSLELLGDARRTTFDPEGLVRFILDPERLPHSPRPVERLTEQVGELLRSRAHPAGGPAAFNQWEVVDTLDVDDDVTEYRARHRYATGAPEVRLRVVSLSPYAFTPEELVRQRQAAAREFAALQRMGAHENVVGAQDMFEDDQGNVVLVVPEVSGTSLGLALAEGLDLDDRERLSYLAGLCRAVQHAHDHGVVHRQVVPENVLLADGGGVRLAGFGRARIAGEGTVYQTSMLAGDESGFGAPELVDPTCGRVGPGTDLFGLACIAWALWTDAPPFAGGVRVTEAPVCPEGLPDPIYEVIAPWLHRRVDERTGAASELLGVVERLLAAFDPSEEQDAETAVQVQRDKAPLEFSPGDVIEDRYEVRAVLGRGGFSTVYRVYDSMVEIEVALKLFRPEYGLETVQRELQALRHIDHPNVVRFLGVDRTRLSPRQIFLNTEFVDGRTLSEVLADGASMPVEEAVPRFVELLDALASFHPDARRIEELKAKGDSLDEAEYFELRDLEGSGLVHRDIKPQNLMLTDDGHLVLIDFNIASPVGSPVHTVAGTPGYQPPDADLTRWDVSPDLFAVGVVLFEALTGSHPYADRNPGGDGPCDPCSIVPDLPRPIGDFLMKACAQERGHRFSTAVAMRGALLAAVDEVGGELEEEVELAVDEATTSTVASSPAFHGIEVPVGDLPADHRRIGSITTGDHRFPLVVAPAPDASGSARESPLVLSAVTVAGDRRYAAARGAYVWQPDGRALAFEQAVAADWVVDGPAGPLKPRSEQVGASNWRFTWTGVDLDELGVVDLMVQLDDQEGSAFVAASARPASESAATPEPVERTGIVNALDDGGGEPIAHHESVLDRELVEFLASRAGTQASKLPLMEAWLAQALARGDVEVEYGTSTRSRDGKGTYLMLRWKGPQRAGVAAYLWPGTAMLTWRLPTSAGEGRRYTEVRGGKNQSAYQLKSTLVDEASVAEALDLLEEAVAVLSGREVPAEAPPPSATPEAPPAPAFPRHQPKPTEASRYGYTARDWERLVDAGEAFLVGRARLRSDTDYSTFCLEVRRATELALDPHDLALREVLGDIGRRTFDREGVVVTALVRYKDAADPGEGFYTLCQELGLLPKGKVDADEKMIFRARHVEEVFNAYRRRRPGEPLRSETQPGKGDRRSDNRTAYAEVQRLEQAGEVEAAKHLALERGWADLATAIEERAAKRVEDQNPRSGGAYVELTMFLRGQRGDRVKIAFDDLEETIGRALPASARTHRPWWANDDGHTQARAWLAAGWRVHRADLALEEVEFRRS
jgi:serine/threonine protein kinase